MTLKNAFTKLSLLMLLTAGPQLALAQSEGGSNGGGGGDMESEFKAIASNIRQWVEVGGGAALKLPRNLSASKYKQDMLKEISSYSIEMTPKVLKYGGSVKTCVSRRTPTAKLKSQKKPVRNEVMCNLSAFRDTYKNNMDGAFRLVHHEFAGLANLEQNRGQESDYVISDQISKFLEDEVIRRLPIDLSKLTDPTALQTSQCDAGFIEQKYYDPNTESETQISTFKSQISSRDVVIWMLADKNSALSKALAKAYKPDPDLYETIEGVGSPISVSSGGRTNWNDATVWLPIIVSGKRWTGVAAYVEVEEFFHLEHEELGTQPKPNTFFTYTVTKLFSPTESFKPVVFSTGASESKNCKGVKIPVNGKSTLD